MDSYAIGVRGDRGGAVRDLRGDRVGRSGPRVHRAGRAGRAVGAEGDQGVRAQPRHPRDGGAGGEDAGEVRREPAHHPAGRPQRAAAPHAHPLRTRHLLPPQPHGSGGAPPPQRVHRHRPRPHQGARCHPRPRPHPPRHQTRKHHLRRTHLQNHRLRQPPAGRHRRAAHRHPALPATRNAGGGGVPLRPEDRRLEPGRLPLRSLLPHPPLLLRLAQRIRQGGLQGNAQQYRRPNPQVLPPAAARPPRGPGRGQGADAVHSQQAAGDSRGHPGAIRAVLPGGQGAARYRLLRRGVPEPGGVDPGQPGEDESVTGEGRGGAVGPAILRGHAEPLLRPLRAVRARADAGGGVPPGAGTLVLELLQLRGLQVRHLRPGGAPQGLQEGPRNPVERGRQRPLRLLAVPQLQPRAQLLPRPPAVQAQGAGLRGALPHLQDAGEVHAEGDQPRGDGGAAPGGTGDHAAHLRGAPAQGHRGDTRQRVLRMIVMTGGWCMFRADWVGLSDYSGLMRMTQQEQQYQRRRTVSGASWLASAGRDLELGNTFQNLSVSSPAPVTMVLPSGDMVRQSTRMVWPMRVDTFSILGYFQMLISLKEYPCVLTNSFIVFPKIRLHTCEPVSTERRVYPVRVFRKRMLRSAVPPPEARRPCWCGDHATALTAAMWSANLRTGVEDLAFQIISLLSFPPEQSCCSSGDHFSPHTSCLCATSLLTKADPHRRSRCRIVLSREPVLRREELQEMDPTRLECPWRTRTRFILLTSHRCTSPLLVPRLKLGPLAAQPTDVTVSDNPRSHSFVTLELSPFQRYTFEARPTARKFCVDQSMRFRQKSSWRAGASSTLNGILLILRLALMEVTSSSVKSRAVASAVGSRAARGAWKRKRLLFWKCSMGLSDLMVRLGSLIMHLRQISDSGSEHGSAGEGGLFSLTAFYSCSLAISSGRSCLLAGMKRSVAIHRSLPHSSPTSRQLSKSRTISRSLGSVRWLASVLAEASGDSGLSGQCLRGAEEKGEREDRQSMAAVFSNRNYKACSAIWIQKRISNKFNIIPLEPTRKKTQQKCSWHWRRYGRRGYAEK